MTVKQNIEDGNLVVFEVSGQLGQQEHQQIISELEDIIQRIGHISILVLLKDFSGWEQSDYWADIQTDQIDPYIRKFAIVGDEKWKALAEVFTLKGLRPVNIEYFSDNSDVSARSWLEQQD